MNLKFSSYQKLLLPTLFTLLIIGCLILPQLSSAQGLKDIDAGIDITAQGAGVKGEMTLTDYAAILIQTLLGLLGLIFVILIIYSGVQWMTAAGNEERVTKSKKILINSVIGFLVIILSYAIAQFIFLAIENASK